MLVPDQQGIKPREHGIAEMTVDVYSTYPAPLDHQTLFRWHGMLLGHDRKLETVGGYRRHDDAMQIVSGRIDRPTVHFEAPPSARVPEEMRAFIDWFNRAWKGPPNQIVAEEQEAEPDRARIAELEGRIAGALPVFEHLLTGRDFLFGESFSARKASTSPPPAARPLSR